MIIDSEKITVPVEESPKVKDDVVVSDLATGWMEQSFEGMDE